MALQRGIARVAASLTCAVAASVAYSAPLPALKIDASSVTVSGLSSGGYMATQLHVAWSALFKGAGVIAAGPYYCAQGLVTLAQGRCLSRDSAPPVDMLVATAKAWAVAGRIDPVANLASSKVWLFAGAKDSVLVPALGADLKRFYDAFVPAASIVARTDVPAEHGMPTDDFGSACGHRGLPFIVDCDFDAAGALLRHLLGALQPRNDGALNGRFVEFDQHEFIGAGQGMAQTAWLFVPQPCASSDGCALHVVLHGCGQNVESLGDAYVRHTGYNRWADANRIVVLYPQTSNAALNACWDWWGYSGTDYAQKSAPQTGAIVARVERLAGMKGTCTETLNGWHIWAGRARWDGFGAAVATGSKQKLGWWWRETSLRESPRGHFVEGHC